VVLNEVNQRDGRTWTPGEEGQGLVSRYAGAMEVGNLGGRPSPETQSKLSPMGDRMSVTPDTQRCDDRVIRGTRSRNRIPEQLGSDAKIAYVWLVGHTNWAVPAQKSSDASYTPGVISAVRTVKVQTITRLDLPEQGMTG